MTKINTFYITYQNKNEPIMYYEKDDGLKVDLHLQLLDLTDKSYPVKFAVRNQIRDVPIFEFQQNLDTSPVASKMKKSQSIVADVSYYLTMTKEEISGSKSLTFTVTIDGESRDVTIIMNKEGK